MSSQVPNNIEDERVADSFFLGKCGTEDPDNESDNKLSTEKSSLEALEDRADALDKQRKILEPVDAFQELSRALQSASLSFDNCLYLGNISVRASKKDLVGLLLGMGDLLCFEILIKDKQFRFQSGIAVFRDTTTVKSALETKPFVVFKRKLKISDLVSRNNASTLLTILVRKATQTAAEGAAPFQTSKASLLEAPQQQGSDKCCSGEEGQKRAVAKPTEKHMTGAASREFASPQMARLDINSYIIGNQVSHRTNPRISGNKNELRAAICVKNTDVMRAGLRRSREHETSDCFTAVELPGNVHASAQFEGLARRSLLEAGRFDRREFLDKPASSVHANHRLENLRFNPRVFSHC